VGGRRRTIALVAGGVVVAVVAALLAIGLAHGGGDKTTIVKGTSLSGTAPLPAIAGTELGDGRRLSLASFRGRPLIINLWASWCIPCRREAPAIRRFTAENPRIAFVGIDVNNDRGDARAFARRAGWTHPSIYDPNGQIAERLDVGGLPSTIYVDAAGRIRGRTPGEINYALLTDVGRRLESNAG